MTEKKNLISRQTPTKGSERNEEKEKEKEKETKRERKKRERGGGEGAVREYTDHIPKRASE